MNDLDHGLKAAHERFQLDHVLLRDDLMRRLGAPTDPSSPIKKPPRRAPHWLSRGAAGIAACLAIAAVVWFVAVPGNPTPVYGIEGLAERLAAADSIHVRGWSISYPKIDEEDADKADNPQQAEPQRDPYESYTARPSTRYQSHVDYGSDPRAIRYEYTDGKRYIRVHHGHRTAHTGADIEFDVRFRVERGLQTDWIRTLTGDLNPEFTMLRSERLAGRQTDVYERRRNDPNGHHRWRYLIWLDPTDGLPVQVHTFSAFDDGPERLISIYDSIRINADPPAELLSFDPPPNYEIIEKDRALAEIGIASSGGSGPLVDGSVRFRLYQSCPFAFNIDDRAIVVCWAFFNDQMNQGDRQPDLGGPFGRRQELHPDSDFPDRTYSAYYLTSQKAREHRDQEHILENYHWRWSLIVPDDPGVTIDHDEPQFVLTSWRGLVVNIYPVRLPRQRLEKDLLTAQRLLVPEDQLPSHEFFTLDDVEKLLAEIRSQ